MTDYADNFTPRVRMNYRVQAKDHQLMARLADGADLEGFSEGASKLIALVNTLAPVRYSDWTLLGFEYSNTGSDIWLPLATPALPALVAGTQSTAGRLESQKATQMRYEARGTAGSKASYTIFGTFFLPGQGTAGDFRIATSEEPTVAAFVTGLTEIAPNFYAIDRSPIIPKLYANIKHNDAILKELRGV